jgi:hypothetical protein
VPEVLGLAPSALRRDADAAAVAAALLALRGEAGGAEKSAAGDVDALALVPAATAPAESGTPEAQLAAA